MNQDNGAFEISLRLLGNELIGFKILVDDFKTKWLILSIFAIGAVTAIVSTFGPGIKTLIQ